MTGTGAEETAVPCVPLNVRLRRHGGRQLAIGYEHTLELSDTAGFVWRQIDCERSVADIARAVTVEFRVDLAVALADVRELLDELVGHDLVTWRDSS
jgi:hypothetical protein